MPRDELSIGEIIVRGNQVMHEYIKDPDATNEVIVNGWLHTGDMAVVDQEGYFTIVDRKKDIIISGGENIASVEIEKVIQNHPAVFEVVVIGVPDEKWGEVPKALVVLKPGETASEHDIIGHVRRNLAHFKAPKSVEFLDELPKGGTGKILKREIVRLTGQVTKRKSIDYINVHNGWEFKQAAVSAVIKVCSQFHISIRVSTPQI